MKFLGLGLVAVVVYRTLSFARYSWRQGNRTAAAGAVLLAVLTIAFPALAILLTGF